MSALEREFAALETDLQALLGLLEEAEESFWRNTLARGMRQVREQKLAGATYILGCYGGIETFSDLVIGRKFEVSEPLRFKNLNARLSHLRTRTFDSANAIAARRSW
jgi:hypothetical protein